ncbi:endonuclease III domain-containing protein [Candidatus Halobonum tyrrellensis]|uniref:Endonuclease III n=1 Tax=Candidatus Halobonum tyrrellensis G22 TaxID=1324957 RepID=V4HEB9_9EURY|nr:endonuclease III [Candidatus Halobonum tyrrellensis]ESP89040.1 endonuclease III [Candidatus Halobonum tyrrellensis G22]
MSDDDSDDPVEPAENISGGDAGGGTVADFSPGDGERRAEAVVDELGDLYWRKAYGGQDAFECLVRTILSQNTSDAASQPAHDSLMARYGESEARSASETRTGSEATREGGDGERATSGDLAESLADAARDDLAETISAAGLYNRKSETIVRLAGRVVDEYGGADGFDEFVREGDPAEVRDALLDMKGVGPKTADCVLLFSGGRGGVFPVDTHVHRIARRMGLAPPDADHETVRAELEADVPADKCGFGHTAMIQFGREYCSARTPACLEGPEACPLYDLCERVGVDELSGEVVDPSEAAAGDA